MDWLHHEGAASAGKTVGPAGGGPTSASTSRGTSSYSAERYGTDHRYADPVAASDPAWFVGTIPSAGTYRVEVWYPANSGYNSSAPHLVVASDRPHTINVDQRTNGGRWRSLGTFSLAGGTSCPSSTTRHRCSPATSTASSRT
ncbi:golvesin C-terminal-like domain-containing protein [Phytohabitans kaempferiae]|uniref:golvesin C-terminal-like domain-containing protein n=1 Tax=Phytohabitans kaempferiae TaxID=1620943 RepID=UPI00406BA446